MRTLGLRLLALSTLSAATLSLTTVGASALTPSPDRGTTCVEPGESAAARGGRETDHRDISAAEQERIAARTQRLLARQDTPLPAAVAAAGAIVPVYVHVMAAKNGAGDVTDTQIAQQVQVLNTTFAGGESAAAADTGFTFTLAGTDRFFNDTWHRDGSSTKYRKATRQGGADALNIWLVDFSYLGVATFPWDYARNPGIDGIRVQYSSLPGGTAANYDLGETATHEAGHWFGLYHTFQGGCTATNDEVSDTAAQGSPTNGCPEGRDSCTLPGLDPIHNYMDYSYDTCYDQFSAGQSTRTAQMWAAYRA
ncbi:zinc metalloprotease [Nocardioides psychrotolerans]|uniref:Pregnancy-associated plasma protein-A n=1 Tax=Nocardioides psychrotolerans TaxID=1005945 RepID=A0A1I3D1E9_9ACTN|nr:zinc metalloprotease [Nocardioides psychrotolerans]GEP36993.1 zinc metalloprotease [Nocardioides psychrotolerans]SFH80456.1 Pregnancy-associated plasma protein-A [Nocardioides psychrotolerans]